jgi:hypothetical protein
MNEREKQSVGKNERNPNEDVTRNIKIRDNVTLKLPDAKAFEEKISSLPEFKKSNDTKDNVKTFFRLYWGKNSIPEINQENITNQEESNTEKQRIITEYKNFLDRKHQEIGERINQSKERFNLVSTLAKEKFDKLNELYPDIISNDFIDGIKMRTDIIKNAFTILAVANRFGKERSAELLSGDNFNMIPLELLKLMNEKSATLFSDQEKKYDIVNQKLTDVENLFLNTEPVNDELSEKEAIKAKESIKGTMLKG